MKTPSDYRFGVYIGYSDADTRFACLPLRDFIQSELSMTVYVRDINLVPASDVAECIVEAVNSSWRVVLVVTADYLDRELWAYFTLKTATYMVDPTNPGLIVLLVEQQVRHRLPPFLLRAVPEDNIISIQSTLELDHGTQYTLSRLLVSP